MAKVNGVPSIALTLTLELTEAEARALEALTVYGEESFLEVFYVKLGKSALQPHQDGLRSLFKSVRGIMPGWLGKVDRARKEFETGVAYRSVELPPSPPT